MLDAGGANNGGEGESESGPQHLRRRRPAKFVETPFICGRLENCNCGKLNWHHGEAKGQLSAHLKSRP